MHHSAPCQEILLWYLGHAEQAQVFPVLRGLCSLDGQEGGGASGLHFTPGSDGGAQLAPRGTDRWVWHGSTMGVCLSVCLCVCLSLCPSVSYSFVLCVTDLFHGSELKMFHLRCSISEQTLFITGCAV